MVTLVLAAILVPEDFGLVAMMALFLALASALMESGFKQALIRLKNIKEIDYDTAFYSNIILGLLSYTLLYLLAPIIAAFYNESILVPLIRVAGLNVIISSLQVVQVAKLSKELNFKAQMVTSLPAGLISGAVAIMLAYHGLGVWSLVFQTILNTSIYVLLLFYLVKWRPSKQFSIESFKQMYLFGYKLFLSNILNVVFNNIYVVIIAKFFSSGVAGLYYFANQIKNIVLSQIVGAIQNVTYPSLVILNGDDLRLKNGYRKLVATLVYAFYPVLALLFLLIQPLFEILLGEEWAEAGVFFMFMIVSSIFYPLHLTSLNILKVKGRSDIFLYLEIFKKIKTLVIIFFFIQWGVYGLLLGQIISNVLSYIPNVYFSGRLIGYSLVEQLSDVVPSLIVAVVSALICWSTASFMDLSNIQLVLFTGVIFSLSYLALSVFFKLSGFSELLRVFNERF